MLYLREDAIDAPQRLFADVDRADGLPTTRVSLVLSESMVNGLPLVSTFFQPPMHLRMRSPWSS
jgi:hypothetical protein